MLYDHTPIEVYAKFNKKGVVLPVALIYDDGSTTRVELSHMGRQHRDKQGWVAVYQVIYGGSRKTWVRIGDKWYIEQRPSISDG